mmetsp:Transcript_23486/g.59997  ORF Transcript_23486/g.59997 Transcript_23486/m.59997 type:complete len:446 (-) Transcript_23486:557-1894(-)
MLARSAMCYLLLGVRVFQQSMRNVLSPLLVFMAKDLDVSISQKGMLLSAIAAGYFFTQVPGGALADKMGAKNVITMALLLSACCSIAVPTAIESFGMNGLYYTFLAMGAVQGPLFPCSSVFLARWMPKKGPDGQDEKAWGTSMLDIGISIGSLAIIPLANTLADAIGWRHTYHAIGGASLVFTIVWHILAADAPGSCWFISKDELKFLEKSLATPAPAKPAAAGEKKAAPSGGLLGMPLSVALHPGVWAVFISHIAFNNGAYYMTNWSPTYYTEVLGVAPADAKYHLMAPHVANLAAKSAVPPLVNMVNRKGYSLLASRRMFTVIGFVCAAAALAPIKQLSSLNPWVSTAMFSMANACFGLAPAGFKSNYLDITEAYVGIISGYGNTLGTVASWAGPQMVSYILLNYKSWDLVLASVAAINVLASINYAFNAVVHPVDNDAKKKQ